MFKHMFKGLVITCLFMAAFGLFATTAEARTLQGGRAHTFANNDSRSAVFVTISGGGSYEYVMRDANGIVTGFGIGVGRFQVMAGGETTILSTGSRTVSYPAGRITVRSAGPPLLQRVRVPGGQSVVMENTHSGENRRLVVDISGGISQYDLVIRDRHGQVIQVSERLVFSNITVPSGGSATVYAADQNGLSLIFPAEWTDMVQQATAEGPAVTARTMQIGETLTVTNNSLNTDFTFRRPTGAGNSVIDYTYRRGAFDESLVRTDVTFEKKTLEPGFTWTLTVRRGQPLTLLIPREWLQTGLTIAEAAAPAVKSLEIHPGQSLHLSNTDLDAMYEIIIESVVPGMELQYDYVLKGATALDIEYGIASDIPSRTLLPGGILIISPSQHGALQVVLPTALEAVTAEIVTQPTVFVQDIASGQSLRVANTNEGEFRHIAWRNRLETGIALLDYIAWDHDGQFSSFGVTEADRSWELGPGESIAFTNREQTPLRVYFPYNWLEADIEVMELSEPVLTRQIVRPGGVLAIHSGDQRYDRYVVVEHTAQPMNTPPEYHFVVRGLRDVLDFGVSQLPSISLMGRGQTIVAPARGTALAIVVPTQWYGRLVTFEERTEQPLHRVVLRPNGRLNLYNRLNAEVTVHITGRYFLRWEGDGQRIASRELPIEGDLTIPNRGRATIIGAQGADTEIWIPTEWRSRLLR